MPEAEIQMRLILPMINEASIILSEKLVKSPGDVDLALIFGVGFPPFRGGLLKFADSQGLEKIVSKLEEFSQKVDASRYNVSGYLKELLSKGQSFYH
jgi:3-hydroxyacyl-CoA dehydrogenase/enoyl-CoA hydratase/3-hydroxybutyryl-CoA epimerase